MTDFILAGSRTHSPSGRLAHLTYRQPGVPPGTSLSRPTSARTRADGSQLRPSRIPRSQGQSRDTSPSRSSDGKKYLIQTIHLNHLMALLSHALDSSDGTHK